MTTDPRPAHDEKTIRERFAVWMTAEGLRAYELFYRILAVAFSLIIIGSMLVTVATLPEFGAAENPANNEVAEKYLTDSIRDTGAVNAVGGMILDYRAFDTFGESTVLFVAAGTVLILLRGRNEKRADKTTTQMWEETGADPILQSVSRILLPAALVFGSCVILNGHLTPGGGFSGGAVLGASLILYENAFGTERIRRVLSWRILSRVIVAALAVYAAAKGYSFFMGANHLETGIPLGTPGALFSAGLILPLNLCVGVIVTCTMYGFYTLITGGGD